MNSKYRQNDRVQAAWRKQQARNAALIARSPAMRSRIESHVLPFSIDVNANKLTDDEVALLNGLSTEAARIALRSLASLAKINELDHLGGGLELIPALAMTLAMTDYRKVFYTIEHAHTSIGYYSLLATLGFLDERMVVDEFRRGLDIAGHVSWVPGGTELNGGRLGVMIPAAVGQALGVRALEGPEALVICHCGDAGWISGHALNGFNIADIHRAPVMFVMHRNGIQLSGATRKIMNKDPRSLIASLGIEIIETPTLLDPRGLFDAYREARALATKGRPSMIFPVGYRSSPAERIDLRVFGEKYGIVAEVESYAARHHVDMKTEIWIPGSLMSYRDVVPMIQCLFYVNDLPGGEAHHDGHMKGRDLDEVLANPMFLESAPQQACRTGKPVFSAAVARLRSQPKKIVVTAARPAPGSANLILPPDVVAAIELPPPGKSASPRVGTEAGYAAVAKTFPDRMFVVSCDLDPSTKLAKARSFLAPDHQFEMSIEEQVSAIAANGLAISSRRPQLNVFSTFAAFFEGIAREGFEMWRYQRNLNGVNEGVNVTFHLSHVGSCTGRDHFSGWSLDWITLAMGYLPYLHRFYAPADARAAFIAVKDLAAHYGGHIIGVPRDNLPILEREDGSALWNPTDSWEPVTCYRRHEGAKKAILAMGAPAFLAAEAAQTLRSSGIFVDVHVVNGLPLPADVLPALLKQYVDGIVTVEDGLIAHAEIGLRGFASLVQSAASNSSVPLDHIGIVDPRIAPSEGHMETWEHFGITADAIVEAVRGL